MPLIDSDSAAVCLSSPRSTARDLKFGPSDGFQLDVKRRVVEYFARTGLPERDCPRMYAKTALIMAWLTASYLLLLYCAATWWLAAPLAVSLGLAMAAVGFNIQHDGSHHAYSSRRWINRLMALSLDLLGGSSYIWACKHNLVHHSFTNITPHDDDINIGFLGRLAPQQRRLGFHRLQHLYLWFLYGLLPIKWQFYDDFRDVALARIAEHRFKRPRGWDLIVFVGGKLAFFTLALVVPLLLWPWWIVLPLYLAVSFVQGLTLSVVFQMAHCVEEAAFPQPCSETGRIETAWAAHQVETTVDFGRNSRLLSWFTGGLNFQIEHHLFPRICHLHYPALAPLVEQTCREHGLRYFAHESLGAAVASHFRWLRRMGQANHASAIRGIESGPEFSE